MAVAIGSDQAPRKVGAPVPVFSSAALAGAFERENGFDVSGERFLVAVPESNQRPLAVTVVLNWASTLAK